MAATRIYQMSFFTGFGVSAIVYYILNIMYPAAGAATTFQAVDLSAEEDLDVARQIHADSDAGSDYKKDAVTEDIRIVS